MLAWELAGALESAKLVVLEEGCFMPRPVGGWARAHAGRCHLETDDPVGGAAPVRMLARSFQESVNQVVTESWSRC